MTEKIHRLNDMQEAFAVAVVANGGRKVEARAEAGYSTAMSSASQSVDADKLFNHAKISLRIAELQAIKDKVAEKEFGIDAGYVLRRLKEIDDLDIIDIFNDDMSAFKPLSQWPKSWRTSISGVDIKKIIGADSVELVMEKIKWPDKVKNLEMIGKHVSVKAWDKEEKQDNDHGIIEKVTIEVIHAS